MSKSKVNKSQLIRDLLAKHPGKSPAEIAVLMKSHHGISISGQYVSAIKSNVGKKRGRRVVKKQASINGVLPAALEFVKAVGGLQAAKDLLATIEHIKSLA